jgi:hypothetical protein
VPRGQVTSAREFYAGAGMTEMPGRRTLPCGAWFWPAAQSTSASKDFRPAKGHSGVLVRGLSALRDRCAVAGVAVVYDQLLEGFDRCYVSDPFGNRLELLEPV